MNKRNLISRAAEVLRQTDIRKSVPTQKAVLHVSDDEGNHSNFTIRKQGRGVLFNATDVEAVLDACLAAMEEALKNGEEVYIHGYGTIWLKYRAARRTRIPATGEWVDVRGRWLPKFSFGNKLRMAAKIYDMAQAGEGAESDVEDDIPEDDAEE